MTRPIRIGVGLQPQHAEYSTIRDAVVRAEEIGVDATAIETLNCSPTWLAPLTMPRRGD